MIEEAKPKEDEDMRRHYAELDRYGLLSTEMRAPIYMRKERDFVSDLLRRYLEDLTERTSLQSWSGAKLCAIARKPILLSELESLISETSIKAQNSRKSVAAKKIELEAKKKIDDRNDRINFMASKRLAFKKERAFKRSSSMRPELEPFLTTDDHSDLEKALKSLNMQKRGLINIQLTDETYLRMETDYNRTDAESE